MRREQALCISHDALHDFAGLRDVVDQAAGLSGDDASDIKVPTLARGCVVASDLLRLRLELGLTAEPTTVRRNSTLLPARSRWWLRKTRPV